MIYIQENYAELLHVAPLAAVLLVALGSLLYKFVFNGALNSRLISVVLLLLCSVGIISGGHHHGEEIAFFDPCWGYSVTLLGVAASMLRQKSRVVARRS